MVLFSSAGMQNMLEQFPILYTVTRWAKQEPLTVCKDAEISDKVTDETAERWDFKNAYMNIFKKKHPGKYRLNWKKDDSFRKIQLY